MMPGIAKLRSGFLVLLLALLALGQPVNAQMKAGPIWEAAIEASIAEQAALGGQGFEIIWPAQRPKWPECKEPKVQLGSGPKPVGRLFLGLRCESPRWVGSIQVTVNAKKRYLAAARPLSLGSIVSEQDLTLLEGDWASLPDDVLTDAEQAVGRTISRALVAGQAIGLNFLRQTAVIRSGERVRVQMVGTNFTVGGEAVAAQQGSIGDSIRVKMANGQSVTATVVRAGVVEIRID